MPPGGRREARRPRGLSLAKKMTPDFTSLTGKTLVQLEYRDYTWFFRFSMNYQVATESPWRYIANGHIQASSEDHGHQFGRSTPVDAIEAVKFMIGTERISGTDINADTGDLTLHFTHGSFLQFIQMSSGYESWRLQINNKEYVCTGGGTLVIESESKDR